MAINSGNPLSAGSLATIMSSSLPKDARPQLKNPYDAIALFSHACMIAVGFRLIGLGEDHKIEASSEAVDSRPLPSEWNASSSYAFRYAHSQSSMEYLVKINRLGSKAVVFGMGLGDDKTTSFDVQVKDYISESSFPFPQSSETTQTDVQTSQALQNMFISVARVTDLGALFKLNILQKLAPSIHKEGYEESAQVAGHSSASREGESQQPPGRGPQAPQYDPLRDDRFPPPARPHPFDDPLAANPRRPYPAGDFPPPGFEDEYEINRPPRGGMGGRNPLNIGENDLYPPGLGPHDPLRPSFGPGGGLPRGGGGGGMHPTFDDPLFGGNGGMGGGYESRAPPGARYDPIGPGDGPPNIRGGPRFPGGGMGGPPNPFGGYGGGDFI